MAGPGRASAGVPTWDTNTHTMFLPCNVQFDWLISEQLRYLLTTRYMFYIFQSRTAQLRALNPFLLLFSIFLLKISKNNKVNEKILNKAVIQL